MYQTFIILFRESLEISIILSIIFAATNNLKNRNIYIILGLLAGILGASIIAIFTNKISHALSGYGQEIANAIILLTATMLICWTIVWMKNHGKQLTTQIKSTEQRIARGEISLYSMSFIIALAIFREGSEIVLFMHSIFALNTYSIFDVLLSSLGGLFSGVIVGMLIYFGILKISGKYLFNVTATLLALIAAGMSAQAATLLQATGYLNFGSSQPLWDSSSLITDNGFIGTTLNIIAGYISRPNIIELLFYLGTLIILIVAIYLTGQKSKAKNSH